MAVDFIDYRAAEHYAHCLELFDENCPAYFANNERQDYIKFLDSQPSQYKVGLFNRSQEEGRIVSGFGLIFDQDNNSRIDNRGRLSWILVAPYAHSQGGVCNDGVSHEYRHQREFACD